MKKVYPFTVFPAFLLGKLYYRSAETPNHCKVEDKRGKVIAVKSNRHGTWYIKPSYRWILSQHSLDRLAQKELLIKRIKYKVNRKCLRKLNPEKSRSH